MVNAKKRRQGSEETVTQAEAARMLRVCISTMENFCKRGVLEPVYLTNSNRKHFRVHDVAALAEVRRGTLDFSDVAALATRAFVIAKANEARLKEVLHLVGLKRVFLDTLPEEVGALYEKAAQLSTREGLPSFAELEEWAETLHSIDEAYLGLVGRYTASREPWKVFLDLANKWANDRPYSSATQSLEYRTAYDMLEASRRNLRAVSYMHCRAVEGKSTADNLFGKHSLMDRLLDVMPGPRKGASKGKRHPCQTGPE